MTATQLKNIALFASKLGYQTRSFAAAARKLGVQLAYVTDRCHELSDSWGDQAIPVRFANPEEAAATAMQSLRGKPLDAILALGDAPAVSASYAARGLGLRANHPAAVEACHNKLRMREVFRAAGLFNPPTTLWFRSIPLFPQPEPSLLGIPYPCVLKPLSLSASQGVTRANSHDEFREAARRLAHLLERPDLRMKSESLVREVLVEEYIPGVEVAVEGILMDGDLKLLAIFDKPDPLEGPFFEETIYVTPSRLPSSIQSAVTDATASAAAALGLEEGPVHAEVRVNEHGPFVIELAARSIGWLCSRTLRFGTGMTLEELILRHALGWEVPSYDREARAAGVMMIPIPRAGRLGEIHGIADATAVPSVEEVVITAHVGQELIPLPEGWQYLGFIFARSDTPDQVERALRASHAQLRFDIA